MGKSGIAREDAPTPTQYRAIRRAADEKVDEKYRLECLFVVRTIGELGLRPGAVQHLSRDWVDLDQQEIRIPLHDPCTLGEDGGVCGYCRGRAKQSKYRYGSEKTLEELIAERWNPKFESSARTVPYGYDRTLVDFYERFFEDRDGWNMSRVSINRRLDRALEHASGVSKDDYYPHALRSHAAMYHARAGMRAFQLMEFMGWSSVQSAMDYIKMVAEDVDSELKRVHSTPHV